MKHYFSNFAFPKSICLSLVIVCMGLTFATPSHAQMGPIYAKILDAAQQKLMEAVMKATGLSLEGTIEQAGAATRAEILKSAMAGKTVAESLESYRQRQALQMLAVKTSADLEQPATTCQTVASQVGIGSAKATARAKVLDTQKKTMHKLGSNTNTAATVQDRHNSTNASTCTLSEQTLGVCKVSTDPALRDLAGADHNAAMLFQSKDGSATYEGGPDGPQAQSVQRYIERVINGIPPEQLRNTNYKNSPQGRAYAELLRRYNAVLSMSAYSLADIKESHNAQAGLGNTTKMATVPVPGFAPGKSDMSMLEVVERLVATKFSPKSMESAAAATSPNLILRDMAQMASFQLWMDHQTLNQDERTEAILAQQLSMLTEKTLRPQLEAQRTAATRASAIAR